MEDKINELKSRIIELSSLENFIHHKWFVKWHLEIVEKISLELCEIYKDADKDLVLSLVWMHDYEKITRINPDSKSEREFMKEIEFDQEVIDKVVEYVEIFERVKEMKVEQVPIEVKIVSSADAASHFVGPFYPVYWYENTNKSIEELLSDNNKKVIKDWEKKILLPEVKISFQERYNHLLEIIGNLPEKYIKDE